MDYFNSLSTVEDKIEEVCKRIKAVFPESELVWRAGNYQAYFVRTI